MSIIKDFASWSEYLREAHTIPASSITYGPGASESTSLDWCGARNLGHALAIAEKGWPEGAAMVERISLPTVEHLANSIEHADLGFDVTGAAFDVGEYLAGTPECWITPQHTESKPCVTIVLNASTSAGVSKKAIMMRGAAVTALSMVLQAAGYVVRVYKAETYPCGGGYDGGVLVTHRVLLTDDAGGPLDTDRLMYALAHPSTSRMIGFAVALTAAGMAPGDHVGNITRHFPDEVDWERSADFYLHSAYLDDANWRDEASVAEWVKTQYESLKIKKLDEAK